MQVASHRRGKPVGPSVLSRAAITVAAATAAMLTASGGADALPGPSGGGAGPGAGSGSPEDVRRQVDALYAQAEAAGQRADSAQEQERALLHKAALLQQELAEEQERANVLADRLGAMASAEYQRGGGMDPVVQLLFSAHPGDYLSRAASLAEADSRTGDELERLHAVERELQQGRVEALQQYAELEQLRRSIAAGKAEAQRRLGRAQALLGTLTAGQRDQLQQQEDAAAQLAAQAAGAALPPGEGPASAGAALALAAARSAVGMPYVYGATGPGAFDCSGLMYWAWRHGGVALPRTSQEQAFAGRRVPLSEARPGDLVIYYGDMHHVGMYAGNGMIIHAPYPGARVRYESVRDMPAVAVVRV
ncbi:C40 family peptidase [Streptacidiphilus rugosus]|uniref:C40 family peptidase n=1 Tax=Streptacidiphilus rugosus TaxID=405783 RepID=UPI000B1421DD|nr:C40 family peptidase [Streptacidiphilus rugosus]